MVVQLSQDLLQLYYTIKIPLLTNNSAGVIGGGAIDSENNTSATISNSTFTGNSTTSNGGAIYDANETFSLKSDTFGGATTALGNTAANGGASLHDRQRC